MPIVYIQGSQVTISKKYCISFSEERFCLANSADHDTMKHYAASRLSLHCFPKPYPFWGFELKLKLVLKGMTVPAEAQLNPFGVFGDYLGSITLVL